MSNKVAKMKREVNKIHKQNDTRASQCYKPKNTALKVYVFCTTIRFLQIISDCLEKDCSQSHELGWSQNVNWLTTVEGGGQVRRTINGDVDGGEAIVVR